MHVIQALQDIMYSGHNMQYCSDIIWLSRDTARDVAAEDKEREKPSPSLVSSNFPRPAPRFWRSKSPSVLVLNPHRPLEDHVRQNVFLLDGTTVNYYLTAHSSAPGNAI